MTHGSLFAGIGGQDMGFEQAGWKTLWQVENNPFCLAVLATKFPGAERSVTDVRKAGSKNLAAVDCITAGVPCQDVSVAGKRAGLQGERTGLFFEFARILQELRPAWFVFENVPGLLSSNRGRDFAEVLRVLMVECGYGVCWRVLDSQFFGVAQRRRRVFIVGCLGEPCPAQVLFESQGGAGDSPQGRKAGQGIANCVTEGTGRVGSRGADDGANIVAYPLRTNERNNSNPRCSNYIIEQNTQCSTPQLPSQRSHGTPNYAVAVSPPLRSSEGAKGHPGDPSRDEIRAALVACSSPDPDGVRDFAGLPKGLDSARYRALGNAWTTQVAEWIGHRILAAEGGSNLPVRVVREAADSTDGTAAGVR